jgi:hypothetical protein
MKRSAIAIAWTAALLGWASSAHGQRLTEQFIPLGQSPGISGVLSDTGEIEAADVQRRTVTVRNPEGSRTIQVGPRTRIWLDRSQQRETNAVGSMADLRPGRKVEVRYVDVETKDTADWIKVVVPDGG